MCQCKEFADCVDIWYDEAPSFNVGFTTVDRHADVELRRCETCGMYWQVDVGRGGLAIRIDDPDNWNEFDDRPVRLQRQIDHDGGLDDGQVHLVGLRQETAKRLQVLPTSCLSNVVERTGPKREVAMNCHTRAVVRPQPFPISRRRPSPPAAAGAVAGCVGAEEWAYIRGIAGAENPARRRQTDCSTEPRHTRHCR